MPGQYTYKGEGYALIGNGSDGSLARLTTRLKLYRSSSTPAKDGSGFTEVANGNGYLTGGLPIVVGNWTLKTPPPARIQLADQSWVAAGGSIADVAGAFITDAAGDVLGWAEAAEVRTYAAGETILVDDLTFGLQSA